VKVIPVIYLIFISIAIQAKDQSELKCNPVSVGDGNILDVEKGTLLNKAEFQKGGHAI